MQRAANDNNTRRMRVVAGDGSELPARQKYTESDGDVRSHKIRLAARARIGKDWDGKAANDNIAWPLATALIREGNTELLKVAMAYRRIYDQAKSGALLGGSGVQIREGFALDRFTTIGANGAVIYNRPRQRKGADVDIPAKHYTAPPKSDDIDLYSNNPSQAAPVVKNWTNVPRKWNGDKPVNDMIDAQAKLAGLHAALGPLVEPLEMSVIDCATYQQVGNANGIADRSGSIAAGRAIVHMALIALSGAFGEIRKDYIAA